MNYRVVRAKIGQTYGKRNKARGAEMLFLDMLRYAGKMSKMLRTRQVDKGQLGLFFTRVVGRVMALELLLEVDAYEALLQKYAQQCPYCSRKGCVCLQKHREPCIPRPQPVQGHVTIERIQEMFRDIYGFTNTLVGCKDQLMHLIEEIAEVAESIHGGSKERIAEELADVLAHTFGLANAFEIDLQHCLTIRYSEGCRRCSSTPCSCPPD